MTAHDGAWRMRSAHHEAGATTSRHVSQKRGDDEACGVTEFFSEPAIPKKFRLGGVIGIFAGRHD